MRDSPRWPGGHVGWDVNHKNKGPSEVSLIQSKDLREDLWEAEAKLRVRAALILRQK